MTLQAKVGFDSPKSLHKKPTKQPIGLYLHVPFCATTCDFCAFYQEAPQRQRIEDYLRTLEEELHGLPPSELIETAFFGGGTPGLLMEKDFERIISALCQHFTFEPKELTVELAPSTVRGDKARILHDLGVTRVSLGVQSFDEATLKVLGRQQNPKCVYQAYDSLRDAGFETINLDLMFAYPGQTLEAWKADMDEALRLDPEHLSTYCLTFEEDTALWVQLNQGKLRRDIEAEAALYQFTWDYLPAHGFAQYEIANFAKPGFACEHNLNTWRMEQWLGLGPSASSQYAGWRWTNPADWNRWQKSVAQSQVGQNGPSAYATDTVKLSPELLATDAVIFGLRLNQGIDLEKISQQWPKLENWLQVAHESLSGLADEGLLTKTVSQYRCTNEGRLRVDAIGAEFIEALHL